MLTIEVPDELAAPLAEVAARRGTTPEALALDHLRALVGKDAASSEDAPALANRFRALASEWRAATRFLSSPSAAAEHPTYRAVVALGPAAVPLILADLAAAPEPWFAALRELTGVDPVPPVDRGRPKAAAEHWLAWGRGRGLA